MAASSMTTVAIGADRSSRSAMGGWWGLLLAVAVLGAGIGMRDPAPPDEPRFVLAAQSMIDSGLWWLPMRGSEIYAHKPAVFIWLQAAAWTAVRDWRIAFLLPSLLAALGTLWLTRDIACRLWDRRVATHATLALAVTLQFGLQAKRGQIDMVLVFWTTLALWALLHQLLLKPDRRLALLGGFAAGLGTVTKGVGFLPLLLLVPWHLLPRPVRDARRPGLPAIGAGFIAGTMVWLLPLAWGAWSSSDPAVHAYLQEILLQQTAGRYLQPAHHHQPVWYYLQVIATLWLPGALLLPWLLPGWYRQLRSLEQRQWLLLGWATLVLLFFTLSPGKREVYILPALPALCLAAAPLLPDLLQRPTVRRLLHGYVLIFALASLLAGCAGLVNFAGMADDMMLQRALQPAEARSLFGWLIGVGCAGVVIVALARLHRASAAVVAFTAVLWTAYGVGLAPALDASSSARALMESVQAHIGPEGELGLVAWREQHLLQAPAATVEFGFSQPWDIQRGRAARWLQASPEQRWVFILDEALPACVDSADAVPIGRSNRRDWILVAGTAWPADCATTVAATATEAQR